MDSILNSVKKMLGIDADDTAFDLDIITHVNTVFVILNQLGVGPSICFSITDDSSTWDEFIGGDPKLESVRTYMYQKVRLLFDPPENSSTAEAMRNSANEIEWRLWVENN